MELIRIASERGNLEKKEEEKRRKKKKKKKQEKGIDDVPHWAQLVSNGYSHSLR